MFAFCEILWHIVKKREDFHMIDVDKVRLWTVSFTRAQRMDSLPYPNMVVEEVEGSEYFMPQFDPAGIPPEVGGQVTLTLEGRGILKAHGKTFQLTPGTAFLYRDCDPAVSYRHSGKTRSPWRFVWMNFAGRASERLIADINAAYGYFFDCSGDNSLRDALLSYREYAGAMLFQTPLEGARLTLDLLSMLCRQAENSRTAQSGSHIVREVQSEISQAFGESISTSALAKKVGISREHLSKTFHWETGLTLSEYRAKQRLARAFDLLTKTNLTCKEIAWHCQFGSYSAFFRAFEKVWNVSPEVFRRKRSGK